MQRNDLIRAACKQVGLGPVQTERIVSECPWLDGTTSVARQFGGELVRMSGVELSQSIAEAFVDAFNDQVSLRNKPLHDMQSLAYSEIGATLKRYGKEGLDNGADFWLHDDSFSGDTPVVYVSGTFRPNENALAELKSVFSRYSSIYTELIIATNEGSSVSVVTPNAA